MFELVANIFNLLSVYFANRNSIQTWWTGLVGTLLYGVMFFDARLYADFNLQIFFLATGIWGWWDWMHGGKERHELPITRVTVPTLVMFVVIAAAVAGAHGYLLYRLTDAFNPFVDSVVLVASIVAQFLLMRRKLENWFFWILVDIIAVPLYAVRGLYITSGVYFIFLCLAVGGLFNWLRIWRTEGGRSA